MSGGRLRAALIIAAIAIGSAIAGAGIDRWAMSQRPRRERGGPPGSATPEIAARRRAQMLDRMSRDLSLTPAQRVAIDSIMQRTDSALREVRAEMQPRLTRIADSSRAAITARLDPAQRVEFAKRGRGRRR
jgi:Spy/CpxP family protein refolding chaperone